MACLNSLRADSLNDLIAGDGGSRLNCYIAIVMRLDRSPQKLRRKFHLTPSTTPYSSLFQTLRLYSQSGSGARGICRSATSVRIIWETNHGNPSFMLLSISLINDGDAVISNCPRSAVTNERCNTCYNLKLFEINSSMLRQMV
jgi:hypothetical protein